MEEVDWWLGKIILTCSFRKSAEDFSCSSMRYETCLYCAAIVEPEESKRKIKKCKIMKEKVGHASGPDVLHRSVAREPLRMRGSAI